jgi:ATP-dependent DNA helicase RecQ
MSTAPQSISPPAAILDEALAQLGFETFLPGQREAVEILLDTGRLLLVAPTGGGKSLTYQLPASLLPGTTLVVSPLIALMHDQVQALEKRGVAATYLASTLDGDELRRRMQGIAQGKYKLVYAAPERLTFSGFRSLLREINCPLVAVDEAHCISEWGHDFRPEYLQIGDLVRSLPNSRILACTATATPVVRDEILERLGLAADTPQLLRGFARPNLALRVAEISGAAERRQRVDALLAEALGAPDQRPGTAIIYAPTRKITEEEAARLQGAGWRAAAYHAGMTGPDRDEVQRDFIADRIQVVVATNAFGMGIDRADVRAIVHLAPPSSVEAYYQEVGRAGRDGEDAYCQLLVSAGDMALRRRLIESDSDGRAPEQTVVQHKWNLFLELMRWCEGGSCRHDAILRYFGDEEETLSGCGRCDVCRDLSGGEATDDDETSTIVRKALCAIARLHGRYGIQMATKLLRGTDDARLLRDGLDQTPTFGILKEHSEKWLLQLLRRLVTAGWVDFHGGERPVVILTEEGRQVIHAERPARLLLPPTHKPEFRAARVARPTTIDPREGFNDSAQTLFEALRKYRMELARDAKVPPYVIASDRTLRDIALMRPGSLEELKLAHGIGPTKAEKYGDGLLAIVQQAA